MMGTARRVVVGVVAFGVMTGGAAGQGKQAFQVVNHSGHVIVTLNVSPQGSNRWGPDILGREVLANNEQASVTFDNSEDECVWDIRVTFDDQTMNDERGINLCEISEVEFTPPN